MQYRETIKRRLVRNQDERQEEGLKNNASKAEEEMKNNESECRGK